MEFVKQFLHRPLIQGVLFGSLFQLLLLFVLLFSREKVCVFISSEHLPGKRATTNMKKLDPLRGRRKEKLKHYCLKIALQCAHKITMLDHAFKPPCSFRGNSIVSWGNLTVINVEFKTLIQYMIFQKL
jgi:hypothetical protein